MENFFEKLLNNLVIAAFIPSVVFSSLLFFFFYPTTPKEMANNLTAIYQQWGFLILGISFSISVFLFYTREAIFLIYRGYYLPAEFSIFEYKKSQSLKRENSVKETRINDILNLLLSFGTITLSEEGIIIIIKESKDQTETEKKLLDERRKLTKEKLNLESELSNFPQDTDILPTRLGNILHSSEIAVSKRYGLDSEVLWTHLEQIMPERNLQRLDDSHNQLSLLVNSSFLSFILSFILSVAFFINLIQTKGISYRFLFGALLAIVFGFLFYRSALPIAKSYTRKYCMAFDLFRFEILKRACLPLPSTVKQERDIWKQYCGLLTGRCPSKVGVNADVEKLEYCYTGDIEKNNSKIENNAIGGT
jgi:hypothetical protein